jgi:hypothetical protein
VPRFSTVMGRLGREILITLLLLALGLVAVPAAVFHTGGMLFGPYEAGTEGLGNFYADLLDALNDGSYIAWVLVLAPWACVALLRVALALWRRAPSQARSSRAAGRRRQTPPRARVRRHVDDSASRA